MMCVRVPNDSLGRTVKRTLEVLQNRSALVGDSFQFADLPPVGTDFLAMAEAELPRLGSTHANDARHATRQSLSMSHQPVLMRHFRSVQGFQMAMQHVSLDERC